MDLLVTLFLQITLRADPCVIPKLEATCEQYRMPEWGNEIIWVCEAYYKKVTYEVLLRERSDGTWKLWEMWESYSGGMRPYFGESPGLWSNIEKGAITSISKPSYCKVPKLSRSYIIGKAGEELKAGDIVELQDGKFYKSK